MWSKLLTAEESIAAQPIVYRTLDSRELPARQQQQPSLQRVSEADRDSDQLRARVAELEQALSQQVPAARREGRAEGETAGRVQGEAAVKPVIDRLVHSIQELIEMKPRLRKELEEDAVQLSLAIAKRILRRELHVDPTALNGLVQVAFERMGRSEITRVLVHPEHVATVRDALGALTTRQIEIFADGSREKGTLLFETTRGSLDASVDSQLREIELGLADRLKWR